MTVLGVDPGAATTGYGVVARTSGGAVSLRECGVVRTDPREPLPDRLRCIFEGVMEVLERHAPVSVAIEGVFYARNVRSTVVLGQARGAVMLAASMRRLPVAEYSPAEVKNAITGTGRATKDQIQYMIQQLLRLKAPPRPADAADAVAIALCHCHAGSLTDRIAAAHADDHRTGNREPRAARAADVGERDRSGRAGSPPRTGNWGPRTGNRPR